MSRRVPTRLTIPEVALVSRESESTIRHWVASGRLPSSRPGRKRYVTRAALAAFLDVEESQLEWPAAAAEASAA